MALGPENARSVEEAVVVRQPPGVHSWRLLPVLRGHPGVPGPVLQRAPNLPWRRQRPEDAQVPRPLLQPLRDHSCRWSCRCRCNCRCRVFYARVKVDHFQHHSAASRLFLSWCFSSTETVWLIGDGGRVGMGKECSGQGSSNQPLLSRAGKSFRPGVVQSKEVHFSLCCPGQAGSFQPVLSQTGKFISACVVPGREVHFSLSCPGQGSSFQPVLFRTGKFIPACVVPNWKLILACVVPDRKVNFIRCCPGQGSSFQPVLSLTGKFIPACVVPDREVNSSLCCPPTGKLISAWCCLEQGSSFQHVLSRTGKFIPACVVPQLGS